MGLNFTSGISGAYVAALGIPYSFLGGFLLSLALRRAWKAITAPPIIKPTTNKIIFSGKVYDARQGPVCWLRMKPYCRQCDHQSNTKRASESLTSAYRRSENIRVEAVVVAELKFRDVQRHIFGADFVERADHAALEDRPEAFNRVGVDRADDVLLACCDRQMACGYSVR